MKRGILITSCLLVCFTPLLGRTSHPNIYILSNGIATHPREALQECDTIMLLSGRYIVGTIVLQDESSIVIQHCHEKRKERVPIGQVRTIRYTDERGQVELQPNKADETIQKSYKKKIGWGIALAALGILTAVPALIVALFSGHILIYIVLLSIPVTLLYFGIRNIVLARRLKKTIERGNQRGNS